MTRTEKAQALLDNLHTIKRGEETIWTLKDDAPAWCQPVVRAAHGDMLPDDWRYQMIVDGLCILTDEDTSDHTDVSDFCEAIDATVDVYTSELLRWVSSSLSRLSYVDDACEEMGHSEQGLSGDLMRGQYAEREEVLAQLIEALELLDDDDDA